jgi:hypothetical protein
VDAGVDEAWVHTADLGEPPFGGESPDFVIAVLAPDSPANATPLPSAGPGVSPFTNLDVAIRGGRTSGQGFPVLLIVPPPLPRPSDLSGVVVAPCPLDDFDALRLHLWAFVSTLPARSQLPATPQPASQPTDFDATSILDRLYSIDAEQGTARDQVERLVASLLSQVGAEVFENARRVGLDHPIDLAFLPSRESGEVVLVEIKAGQLNEARLAAAEDQLRDYVSARHASLGLMLYHDFQGRHLPNRSPKPSIIRMSVRELVAGLQTNTLPQLINGVVRDTARWFI